MRIRFDAILVLLLLLLCGGACSSCKDNTVDITGKWERFNDEAAGSILNVKKVGDNYVGTLVHVEGPLFESGFQTGDIKWRDIKAESENYYVGQDLMKGVDTSGAVKYYRFEDVYFNMVSFDILHVSSFAKGKETFGETQKWKRIQ